MAASQRGQDYAHPSLSGICWFDFEQRPVTFVHYVSVTKLITVCH